MFHQKPHEIATNHFNQHRQKHHLKQMIQEKVRQRARADQQEALPSAKRNLLLISKKTNLYTQFQTPQILKKKDR